MEIERAEMEVNPFVSFLPQHPKDMKCKTLPSLQHAWAKICLRREDSQIGEKLLVVSSDETIIDTITLKDGNRNTRGK
jgi:hypothetical protein